MDPTLPADGAPGDTERVATPAELASATAPAPRRTELSNRLELVAALLAGVVGLEFLALIIGVSSGGPYRNFGDRMEVASLNMNATMGIILLVAAMLATLRDVVAADFDVPRSDVGRYSLMAVATLGVITAVLALIGVGLDISREDTTAFGTNALASVIHRLAIVLIATVAAGWALAALGVRITTRRD